MEKNPSPDKNSNSPEKKQNLDQLLMQMTEILEMIRKHKGSGPENPNQLVLDDLEILEANIKMLYEHQKEMFQEANVQEIIDSPATKPKEKQFLKRAQEVEQDAKDLHLALSKALSKEGKNKKSKKHSKNPASKKEMKERRKLFKPLGGDQSWIPL